MKGDAVWNTTEHPFMASRYDPSSNRSALKNLILPLDASAMSVKYLRRSVFEGSRIAACTVKPLSSKSFTSTPIYDMNGRTNE